MSEIEERHKWKKSTSEENVHPENLYLVPNFFKLTSISDESSSKLPSEIWYHRKPKSLNAFYQSDLSLLNYKPSIDQLLSNSRRSQRTSSQEQQKDPNLRVVFQYKGLLEADPTSGSYKKVIPNRLVDPIEAGGYQNVIPGRQVSSGKLVTWRPSLETTKKPKASWTRFIAKRTEPPKNLVKTLITSTHNGQNLHSEPKTTTKSWNLSPIKTWSNPWEGSESISMDLLPSPSTYNNNNILKVLPERKVAYHKPKPLAQDSFINSNLNKLVTWSPSWKNKNNIDDGETSIEDLLDTFSLVEEDDNNKERMNLEAFSSMKDDNNELQNLINVKNLSVLEDNNDEEVDKVNDEIIVPTENDNKLLNWNDYQYDNLDDAIDMITLQTNNADIRNSIEESTNIPSDNMIALQDEDIIGKAVTIIDDDFDNEDPIPLDDVFPTR